MAKKEIGKRKKMKVWRLLRRSLILFIFFCFGGASYSLGVAVFENVESSVVINDFKNKATFEYTDTVMYGTYEQIRHYYVVQRTEDYELDDTRSIFEDEDRKHFGKDGDILMTWDSPFPYIPVIHQFISFYFGGHAALKSEELGYIQATGFPAPGESLLEIILTPGDTTEPYQSVTADRVTADYWTNPVYRRDTDDSYPYYGSYYREKFFGVRVKNIDQETIDGAIDFANSKVNQAMYNFLFWLDMKNKYYCTDFVSRAYQSVMVPEDEQGNYAKVLNDDWFITSVNDILLSDDTYLTFYAEVVDNELNIYYLEDI